MADYVLGEMSKRDAVSWTSRTRHCAAACDGKCAAVEPDGFGELAVEGEKGAGSRGRSIEARISMPYFVLRQGCADLSRT